MPGSLVETRPLESLLLPSQHPGQDSSDSHVNKQMLVFYSLVHSGERGKKLPKELLEGMACQLVLHILPLCFLLGGWRVSKKKSKASFGCWLQGSE